MSNADDIRQLELQLLDATARMRAALSVGDFRRAEIATDQIRSLKRLLEVAA